MLRAGTVTKRTELLLDQLGYAPTLQPHMPRPICNHMCSHHPDQPYVPHHPDQPTTPHRFFVFPLGGSPGTPMHDLFLLGLAAFSMCLLHANLLAAKGVITGKEGNGVFGAAMGFACVTARSDCALPMRLAYMPLDDASCGYIYASWLYASWLYICLLMMPLDYMPLGYMPLGYTYAS
jgi:hypothetical protein